MSSLVKSFALVLFALLLTLVLFPPIVYSQTSRSYTSQTGRMGTYYRLVLYSPNEETTYQNLMLLNFTLNWTYDLIPIGDFELEADYAYSIDDNPFVSIVSNQSSNDQYAGGTTFVINPSFSYLIDISNLSSGYHNVVIRAIFYFGKNLFLNDSSTPFSFKVQNPIPEFPTPLILPLFTAILLAVIILKKVNLQRRITRINNATNKRLP